MFLLFIIVTLLVTFGFIFLMYPVTTTSDLVPKQTVPGV